MENVTKDPTMPTVARVSRVEAVLTSEPAFKDVLGKKEVSLTKKDGTKVNYCAQVVEVAKAIHAAGQDAVSLSKNDILKYAMKVLKVSGGPAEAEMDATAATAPVAESTAAETETKAETKAEPAPEVETGKPEVTVEGVKAAAASRNQNMSVVSLLCSAEQMSASDKKPGAESRRAKLNALIKEYGMTLSAE